MGIMDIMDIKKCDIVEIINLHEKDYDTYNGSLKVGQRYMVIDILNDNKNDKDEIKLVLAGSCWRNIIPLRCAMLYKKTVKKKWWKFWVKD